jgi:uncharacterized protein (TIGR00299 family) protein
MILGALIDAGLPIAELRRALGTLGVGGWDILADRVVKCGITATKFRVTAGDRHEESRSSRQHHHHGDHQHDHPHRTVAEIKHLIDHSALSAAGKARAKRLFDRLAAAEASVHNMPVEQVHLHEVGALDSIIDIVGTVFALEWFGADQVMCSPINVGTGMVKTAHGMFPVPAPATVKLLGDAPVYSKRVEAELLTPTGALLLSEYATAFGPLPMMRITKIGYGAGDRDLEGTPNVVRVLVGEAIEHPSTQAPEHPSTRVLVLQCEIDDMNPQIFGALMDRLQQAGALDVFYAPVQMKKNRPGTLMTVIAKPADRAAITDLVFRESTTIGVRYIEMDRECLDRETIDVTTPHGMVRFKVARSNGRILNAQPEFEDIMRVAAQAEIPLKEMQSIATRCWLDQAPEHQSTRGPEHP